LPSAVLGDYAPLQTKPRRQGCRIIGAIIGVE